MGSDNQNITWPSWLNVIAGIWMIISPFILGYSVSAVLLNALLVGIVVGVVSLIKAISPENSDMNWTSWVDAILGAWLIISPFIIKYVRVDEIRNSIIMGVIIAVFGLWSLSTTGKKTMTTT